MRFAIFDLRLSIRRAPSTNRTRRLLLALLAVSVLAMAPAGAGPGGGTLVVSVPPGDYTLWLEYRDASGNTQAAPPVRASGAKAALDLTPLGQGSSAVVLVALDGATGNAAAKPVSPKAGTTTEVALAAADISAVGTLRVRALGADRQPVLTGSVTLTDGKGTTQTRPILPGREGVDFDRVPFGRAKLKVAFPDGTGLEQDIDVKADHPPGALIYEVSQAGPAGATPAANVPAATAPAANAPAANAPGGQPPDVPATAPEAPADAPADVPAAPAPPSGPGPVGTLVGLLLLGAIGYVAWRMISQRNLKLDDVMKRLGVELPAQDPAAAPAKPAPPPAPSVPEGHCPFCGQAKDPATGACACSVAPGDGGPGTGGWGAAPGSGPPSPVAAAGARLVVVQGPHLGASFPLPGDSALIGRAAESGVPLPQDSTVSRRHASLARQGGGFRLRDEGSANGTYVNGLRVTERALQPGDEIQVGNTRMRFEGS